MDRLVSVFWLCCSAAAVASEVSSKPAAPPAAVAPVSAPLPATAPPAPGAGPLYVAEYRVVGARQLPRIEVEAAVYPFLGPGRSETDLQDAAKALEDAYKDQGYQTVTVQVPPQQMRGGVVILQVTEAKVGRLRVHGSRYFSLDAIKKSAPSLAEGKVPNFNEITRDIVALNRQADRRITPTLRAGVEPGTVDIDLNVKDTFPLHGSVEINNRYSPDSSELRLNGAISYHNLWQAGHAAGVSFQVSPQNREDVKVISGYYQAPVPRVDWLSLLVQGTKQDSNVSTLGGVAVAGRGDVVGLRAIIGLPPLTNYYHSVSLGLDYKHFLQNVSLGVGSPVLATPITYYPLSVAYNGSWVNKNALTELNAAVNFHLRGTGSDSLEFENNRFKADGNFIYFRGDLAHTQDLPGGFQAFGKVQGQISDQPLVSSEQMAGGGLGTARGYLEAEAVGDNGAFGTFELRSPSLLGWNKWSEKLGEWRVYGFVDGGVLSLRKPLPEQERNFRLASYGVGSRISLFEHLNGSIDAGLPLTTLTHTQARSLLLTFRLWADF